MTSARMLRVRAPLGLYTPAYRFGGTMAAALIVSNDCLISPVEGAFIAAIIKRAGPGDYVEVGCAFGGTAILAALTKKVFDVPGKVVTIDNFTYSWCPYEAAMNGITGLGLEHHIEIKMANSHPWPLSPDRKFVIGYVDGSHRGEMPYNDLVNMSKCVEKYILIHDYGPTGPDVMRGTNRFDDDYPEWVAIGIKQRVVVFERQPI